MLGCNTIFLLSTSKHPLRVFIFSVYYFWPPFLEQKKAARLWGKKGGTDWCGMRGFSDTCGNPEIGSIKRIMALTPIGRRHIWMWCVPPICKRHVLLLVSEEKLPLNTKKPGAGPGSKRHTVCDYMTIVVNLPWRVWRRGESAPRRNAAVVFLLVNILASSVAWMTQQTQALINGKLLFFLLMYSSTESTWEQSFLYYFPHCSI